MKRKTLLITLHTLVFLTLGSALYLAYGWRSVLFFGGAMVASALIFRVLER